METNEPGRETRLPRNHSPATACSGRITIARLLWATAIIAFACFWVRFLASEHYYLGRWLFFALTCGAIGAVFGGHLGAWVGMGVFGLFLPLLCVGVYTAWQDSAIAAIILIGIGLHILNLPSIAARYYGNAEPMEREICFHQPEQKRKRDVLHGNLGYAMKKVRHEK